MWCRCKSHVISSHRAVMVAMALVGLMVLYCGITMPQFPVTSYGNSVV